jgi:hypothetical protein
VLQQVDRELITQLQAASTAPGPDRRASTGSG